MAFQTGLNRPYRLLGALQALAGRPSGLVGRGGWLPCPIILSQYHLYHPRYIFIDGRARLLRRPFKLPISSVDRHRQEPKEDTSHANRGCQPKSSNHHRARREMQEVLDLRYRGENDNRQTPIGTIEGAVFPRKRSNRTASPRWRASIDCRWNGSRADATVSVKRDNRYHHSRTRPRYRSQFLSRRRAGKRTPKTPYSRHG